MAESLVEDQKKVIALGVRALAMSDSLLVVSKDEADALNAMVLELQTKYDIQFDLTAIAIAEKRKWFWIAIGALILAAANFFH